MTERPHRAKNVKRNPVFPKLNAPTPELLTLATNLALLSLDNARIAAALGIAEVTLDLWQKKFPALREAIHSGKDIADTPVVAGLFEIARKHESERVRVGADGQVVKYTETTEADFRAASHVLACRHPEKWGLNRARDGAADAVNEQAVADLLAQVQSDAGKVQEISSVAALLGLGGAKRDQR